MKRERVRRGATLVFGAVFAITVAVSGAYARPVQAAVAGVAVPIYTAADSRHLLGGDGRFTVLLLGSDARPSIGGLRTDAILIASVDPVTGKAAIASIPRDTAYFPMAPLRSGTFSGRINALYSWIRTNYPKLNPGTELRLIIGRALGIEIDAYAMLGFEGFRKSVNNVGGLRIYVPTKLHDPVYSMRAGQHGVTFNVGWQTLLDLRALAYARIRHLAGGDYNRARRQQQLIAAAVETVRGRGVSKLSKLIAATDGLRATDLDLDLAPLIFAIVSRADVAHSKRVVFQPTTYAYGISSYRIVMKLTPVRNWVAANFPPRHNGLAWLPPQRVQSTLP
jgi:LCP family protein required for cell wall assembly